MKWNGREISVPLHDFTGCIGVYRGSKRQVEVCFNPALAKNSTFTSSPDPFAPGPVAAARHVEGLTTVAHMGDNLPAISQGPAGTVAAEALRPRL